MIRIAQVALYELTLPLAEPFIISGGTMTERRSLIVVLHDADGHVGYGESPPFGLPFYSEETLGSARHLLENVLLPRVLGPSFISIEALDTALRAGIRGNPFARAGLETAAWDLAARREGRGIADVLSDALGVPHVPAVPCGVALGIPPDRAIETLRAQVAEAAVAGYRRVKIKVMPGWDAEPVAAVADMLKGTDIPLTVDANGSYEWPRDEAALRTLDGFGLLYIEQPLPPDELVGHATLGRELVTPICLDETLRDARAARQILELGGPTIWNVKVHRVGGLSEVCRIWRIARAAGVRLWAGTMPESGIGSQAALAAASLPGFDLPSDLEPSARWFGRNADVIKLTVRPDGMMTVPRQPISRLLDERRFRTSSERLLSLHAPDA
ncbi:MAG TPA: o-succinylbenzoate synthase [Gemmatimonadales bacterium]|nr:o-succinylbenzoate synthase [Gemmatimonadales bacterium]